MRVERAWFRTGMSRRRSESRPMRPIAVALAGAVAIALFAVFATSAVAFDENQPYKALTSTTGNNSELTDRLKMGTASGLDPTVAGLYPDRQGAYPTTVMSLPIPNLQAGDQLKVSSELEVTTDCNDPSSSHCIGNAYTYNPVVDTQLFYVTPDGVSTPISELKDQRCRQQTPDRHHHCVPVFPQATYDVPAACSNCHVDLVAAAYNTHTDPVTGVPDVSKDGDFMIVGEDEPDHTTVQDKGRINAVRLRNASVTGSPTPTPYTGTQQANSLLVGDDTTYNNTVVFSQQLNNLKKGEQLAASADMVTNLDCCATGEPLPYNSLVRSRLILASGPTKTTISGLAQDVTSLSGQVTETNGFNCTHLQHTSLPPEGTGLPWDNPCLTQKVGVTTMTGNASKLYLNLVVGTKANRSAPNPGDRVSVAPGPDGGLHVVRYPASMKG
jgi:hypothetical protein